LLNLNNYENFSLVSYSDGYLWLLMVIFQLRTYTFHLQTFAGHVTVPLTV